LTDASGPGAAGVRERAEEFHQRWLEQHPLAASAYGIPGFEHLMPDASEEAQAAWRAEAQSARDEASAIDPGALALADRLTRGCLISAAEQEIRAVDSAAAEHTVTAMPFGEPAGFFAVAARTVLMDADAAEAYLERLGRAPAWIDQLAHRLRTGAAKGRVPVAPLVEQTLEWAAKVLADPAPAALMAPRSPDAWAGAAAWEDRRRRAAEAVQPALARWRETIAALRPQARSEDRAGLIYLPGGEEDYDRAVRTHTTLSLTPEQLHRTGLEEIDRLEARAVELGRGLGLTSLAAVLEAIRGSAGQVAPEEAIAAAVAAIRRAEEEAPIFFPAPLPPPCEVTPMPPLVAQAGTAPHYTPPRLDGGRPGTFWFNTERPTAGTGWDLEAVAFHEAVPGHHLQLSRLQRLEQLPEIQRQRSITVFSEGWGLYAECLAGEVGLYSDARAELGAVAASLMRAARLVVDTGLHAYGWSRARAVELFTAHVPMPPAFLANEIDRYLVTPGQALAYTTGQLELLRQRGEAHRRLGSAFTLAGFHAAVLDHGSLPMPVLSESLAAWDPTAGRPGAPGPTGGPPPR
jgi:uncharacterized protein (DUF885 family)